MKVVLVMMMKTRIVKLLFWLVLATAQAQLSDSTDDQRCFLDGGGSTETFFVEESLAVGAVIGALKVRGQVGKDIVLRLREDPTTSPVDMAINSKNLVLTSALDKENITGPASVSINVLCQKLNSDEPVFPIPVSIRVTDVNDNAPRFEEPSYTLNVSEMTMTGTQLTAAIKAIDNDQPGPFSTVEYSVVPGRLAEYVRIENPLEPSLTLAKSLDYESIKSFQVRIVARDRGTPPKQSEVMLTINVRDGDDQNPAFFHDHYEAQLPEAKGQGQKLLVKPQDIRAFDQDLGLNAPVFYTFGTKSQDVKYFELNRNTGHIYIKADIPEDQFLQPRTIVIRATQFDNPDRYAITTLTVSRGGIFHDQLEFLQDTFSVQVLENEPLNNVLATLITNRPSDRRVHFEIRDDSLPDREFSVNAKGEVMLRKALDFEVRPNYSFLVDASDGISLVTARVNVSVVNINDWGPEFKYPEYVFFVKEQDMFEGYIVGKLEVSDGDSGDRVSLGLRGRDARAFEINTRGELMLQDIGFLNSTEAHLVAVAEDSGLPPRTTSATVLVRFADELKARLLHNSNDSVFLENSVYFAIFATLLVFLVIVIFTLGGYICFNRKRFVQTHHVNHADIISGIDRDKLWTLGQHVRPLHNPIFHHHNSDLTLHSSRRSSTETLNSSAVLNPLNPGSGSHRYSKSRLHRHRVSPTPSINSNGLPEPKLPMVHNHPMPSASELSLQRALRDNILHGGSVRHNLSTSSSHHSLEWPEQSISRRVKKLSWDEAELASTTSRDRDISTLLTDPNVSVTPVTRTISEPPQVSRAIYF